MISAGSVHNSVMKSCTFGCWKAHADRGSLCALEGCQSRRESYLAGTDRNFERYWTPKRIYITYKEEVRTVQRTQRASIRQTNRWLVVSEIEAVILRIRRKDPTHYVVQMQIILLNVAVRIVTSRLQRFDLKKCQKPHRTSVPMKTF